MKVLMLNYEFPPVGGGAAHACYNILKEFASMPSIHVDLITSSPNRFCVQKFAKNVTIHKLDVKKEEMHHWKFVEMLRWSVATRSYMKTLMKNNSYDVCHCWFGWPSGVLGWNHRREMPYIVALRGSDVPGYNKRLQLLDTFVFRWISKVVWKHANGVIANSSGLKKLAQSTSSVPIEIIPNGVNTTTFVPERKRSSKSKKTSKDNILKIICVARLIERKGIRYLIGALKGLEHAHATIIGEGVLEQELKELVKQHGLEDIVDFVGFVPNEQLPTYYKKADVLVFPSLNEGMSNTVLESMASGLALIITNTSGTKELVKGNGIVVSKRSSAEIHKALKRLQRDKVLLRSMQQESRKRALAMNWKNVAKQYMEVYKACL